VWNIRNLIAATIILGLASVVLGSPDNSAQIRKEYKGQENVPDHLMFAFTLRFMKRTYENEREFALVLVQENMKLGSEESAERFLQRMLAAGADLESRRRYVNKAVMCQDNSLRSNSQIYRSLDALDDAYVTIAKYAYDEFKSTLKKDEKKRFKAWMEEFKEGYSHTAFDHSSVFESTGVDVKTHLQQVCMKAEQDELAREQQ